VTHRASPEDLEFQRAFEACETPPAEFDHAAHVRLAYIYLCAGSVDASLERMKRALRRYVEHLAVDASKYHETITRAWVMAVDYFMGKSEPCTSAAAFTAANPELLDSKIMLTHYSAEVLFSATARESFVRPDIQSIPPPMEPAVAECDVFDRALMEMPEFQLGRELALREVGAGHLRLRRRGLPAPWSENYWQLALERLGVEGQFVGGCVVLGEEAAFDLGYNEVMQEAIERIHGPEALSRLQDEARAATPARPGRPPSRRPGD